MYNRGCNRLGRDWNRGFGSVNSPKKERDEEGDLPGRSRSRDGCRKVIHAPARGTAVAAVGGAWAARAASSGGRSCRVRSPDSSECSGGGGETQ